MNSLALPHVRRPLRCYYRPLVLASAGVVLLGVFWFASRYPQLVQKASHVGRAVPSMAFGGEVVHASARDAVFLRILAAAANWLASMRVGMTFGVLLGALLHTTLKYYPLRIGSNLYLNSLRGALIGVPAGVCANCSVPVACGVTRGEGRVEVALGFLFSSPNFNPVVVAMTFVALPLAMAVTKYVVLMAVIGLGVPLLVRRLERTRPFRRLVPDALGPACEIPRRHSRECDESLGNVISELGRDFTRNVWMLVKPTITLMVLASLAAGAMLIVVPWAGILSRVTVGRAAAVSLLSTLMPVPIALDVMFAAQLRSQGVASGYVMLFAMTLGTYSVLPAIYLWREVSRRLAVALFTFFFCVGMVSALVF